MFFEDISFIISVL